MSTNSNKRYLFQLNHPAHFHLFKHTIRILKENGHDVLISIKDKDILKDLVKDYEFVQLSEGYRKKNIYSILKSVIDRDRRLLSIVKKFKPNLMIGTSPEIGHVSRVVDVPSLFLGEDDVNLSTTMYLAAFLCYPFFSNMLTPYCVNNGIWKKKATYYNGFQKLAYLHPNYFTPDRKKVRIKNDERYFIIRFSGLTAYHDTGIEGISDVFAKKIIKILSDKGRVIISSERPLPKELEKYRFDGDVSDMHHYLAFADLFIGDSQTMCAEAGLLGTPFIRYNDFVNKISYLNEIEKKYKLGYGIKIGNDEEVLEKIKELLSIKDLKNIYVQRKVDLLEDKIDVTAFYVWFIENYPQSVKIIKENPEYQNKFK